MMSVQGSMQLLNPSQSLIFSYPFMMRGDGPPARHTLEGLWWKHDPGVGGFVAVTNAADHPNKVSVQIIGARGTALHPESTSLQPHEVRVLDLDHLIAALPRLENRAGGVRVEWEGVLGGDVMLSGGLVNEREGYSATMPFWLHDPNTSRPLRAAYASLGLIAGEPDPADGFPVGTRFTPYLALRNTTLRPELVMPVLHYMNGTRAVSRALEVQVLRPGWGRQVDMKALLARAGLEDYDGRLNLTLLFLGRAGDVVMSAGSVDDTGTYVFEVPPEGVGPSWGKEAPLWDIADGFDTVYTVWNPKATVEDVMVTFYYGDGSGTYKLPVRLGPHASANIDVAKLIAARRPDPDGQLIPAGIQQGSAVFSSPKGPTAPMILSVAAGTFNVKLATCILHCICCFTGESVSVSPNPCDQAVGSYVQATATLHYSDGTSSDVTKTATWSSKNTSIATVAGGLVHGVAGGSTNVEASINSFQPGVVCGYGPLLVCPTILLVALIPVNIQQLGSFNVVVDSNPISGETNSVVSGQTAQITVTAIDEFSGQTFYGYTGTVNFSAPDDKHPTLPPDYTFTTADNGSHTFDVTLKTVTGQTPTDRLTVRDLSTGTNATGQDDIYVWFQVTMDVERWKNCGFIACPSLGSYFCQTAYYPSGLPQNSSFMSVTYSSTSLKNVGVLVVNSANGASTSTQIKDAGPTTNQEYWNTGVVPSCPGGICGTSGLGGCLSDALMTTLGIAYGCNPNKGQGNVYWRFQ